MIPDQDDDKTIIRPPSRAGADATPAGNPLPIGTRLNEFEIVSLVGVGGFGIVYRVFDHSLGREVAVKEYMPQSLAARGASSQVRVLSEQHVETFEAGRRSFVNEARLLAMFDHPSLVKVYRFWEANGTAYMVMPLYRGRTLKDALRAMPAPPDEAWLVRLLAPLLDAVETIHEAQVCHRDIAPDNIMLLGEDRPLLLDFGAARRVVSEALTVILKPGYAPIEQYDEGSNTKQGPWTDIYALSAVVYFAITGKTPMQSVARLMDDPLVPLAQQAEGRYSDAFLRAIDHGLAVRPADRPQTIAAFRSELALPHYSAQTTVPADLPWPLDARTAPAPRRKAIAWAAGTAAALAGIGVAAFLVLRSSPQPAPSTAVAASAPSTTAQPSTTAPPSATAQPSTTAQPTPTALPSPVPAVEPTVAQPSAPDPLQELDRIFEQRDRDHAVVVSVPRSQVTIDRDKLRFSVRSSKGGYLYVLMVGTDRQHFYLLFPNEIDKGNRVAAGGRIDLPREGWSMEAGGPPGTNNLVAVVSDNRRDFSTPGLTKVGPFAEFPLEAALRATQGAKGAASPFVGKTACADGGDTCSSAYGAAAFTIEEVAAR